MTYVFLILPSVKSFASGCQPIFYFLCFALPLKTPAAADRRGGVATLDQFFVVVVMCAEAPLYFTDLLLHLGSYRKGRIMMRNRVGDGRRRVVCNEE